MSNSKYVLTDIFCMEKWQELEEAYAIRIRYKQVRYNEVLLRKCLCVRRCVDSMQS